MRPLPSPYSRSSGLVAAMCLAFSTALAGGAMPARAAPAPTDREPLPATGPDPDLHVTAILTHTRHVEDIAVEGDTAWVATRGGLEVYGLLDGRRRRLYTTADGLAEIHVHQVRALAGRVQARTRLHRCQLEAERFTCTPAPAVDTPEPTLASRFQDARVTARAVFVGGELIGTAGSGLWLRRDRSSHQEIDEPILLTPGDQVCSNHMMAMAEFREKLYLGSFDEGLCVTDGARFWHHPVRHHAGHAVAHPSVRARRPRSPAQAAAALAARRRARHPEGGRGRGRGVDVQRGSRHHPLHRRRDPDSRPIVRVAHELGHGRGRGR